jgi:hypothetical protein
MTNLVSAYPERTHQLLLVVELIGSHDREHCGDSSYRIREG